MKKRFLILAAVAVSGVAAVVAPINVKFAEAANEDSSCIQPFVEHYRGFYKCCVPSDYKCFLIMGGRNVIVYSSETKTFYAH